MKKLKDNSGITMITLVVTIVVMMILTIGVTISTTSTIELKKYNEIKQDIIALSEDVKTYYLENGELPIYTDTVFNLDTYGVPTNDRNPNDSGNYYAIDVSLLSKYTSINKGEGNKNKNFNTKDLYVVNEESFTVYYLNGAVLDGKKHYTIVDNFAGGSFATDYYSKVDLPIISVVTMESNGKDKSLACTGDTVTLKILANYELTTKPTVKINGEIVNVIWNGKMGIASYKLPSTNDTSKYGKEIPFSISSYTADGRIGEDITKTDFGKTVYRYDGKKLPTTAETTPYFPGDDFSHVVGTDLSNGLVIQDPQGNQYVWVEVPRNPTVYPTAGLNITNFTDEEYTKIETDLHTYTNTYRNGTSHTDTYYADSTTGWFTDANAYNTAQNKMLKSVYQNGGFWIGRYEAGIETPRTASGTATTTPLSKANLYPYNYVKRTQAKVLAEQVLGTSGEHTSSLMFGVQWDLVLKYIETKEVAKGTGLATIQSALNSNSTNWGNYANAEILITNTNAKYAIYNKSSYTLGTWNPVPNNYTKPNSETENKVLLSTGANETRNSKQHICDLAGNAWEWTLEYTSYTGGPCAKRGGRYYNDGSDYPASYRSYDTTAGSDDGYGFRVSLY